MGPQSSNPIPPSRFWPGFALGFFVLAFLSCGGLFMLTGLNRLTLAEFQPGEAAWTPPPVTATTPPDEITGAAAPETAGAAGELRPEMRRRNATNSRVNVRRSPGYLSKPGDDVLFQLQPGDEMVLLEGPVPADNLRWWRVGVETGAGPREGWVAEATASGVIILGE